MEPWTKQFGILVLFILCLAYESKGRPLSEQALLTYTSDYAPVKSSPPIHNRRPPPTLLTYISDYAPAKSSPPIHNRRPPPALLAYSSDYAPITSSPTIHNHNL